MMQVITKVKDQIIQISKIKTVSVNLAVGHLIFYPNKNFEFKTSGSLNLNGSKLRATSNDINQHLELAKNMTAKDLKQLAA